MKKVRPGLELINRELSRAVRILNRTAGTIRDAEFDPNRNVKRIGEALVSIFEIQWEIYRARPDLLPQSLADTKLGRQLLSNNALEPTGTRRRPAPGAARRRGGKAAGGSTRKRYAYRAEKGR